MALDIQDRLAIQELLERYCHKADYYPPERMRDMFAADGIFEVPAMELRFEGIESIIAFFKLSRENNSSTRHVISNIVIEGDGDQAKSSAYLQVLSVKDGLVTPLGFGRYMDQLRRYPEGWRLQHRTVAMG